MRAAYADPPYLGVAVKHYGHLHPDAAEYDTPEAHKALIDRIDGEHDAWALSLSTTSLGVILPMCPPDVRVMAWTKPFASFKPGVGVAYAWEPVIVRGGRKRTRQQPTVRDYCAVPITLKRGIAGAKPRGFCYWLFEVLNLWPDDELIDIFPGSGAVSVAWEEWRSRNMPVQLDFEITGKHL